MSSLFILFTAIVILILLISYFKVNAFLSLFCVSIVLGLAIGLDTATLIASIKSGFGHTMEKIGLLIIFGVVLGEILEKSGAMEQMAGFILKKVGPQNTPLAIVLIGFLVGLPIFCDSGFILLSGLLFSLRKEKNRLPLVIALAGSLYAVHCLVPPHPGILAATTQFNANLGLTMLMGSLVAIIPTICVYFYALSLDKKNYIALSHKEIFEVKTFQNSTFKVFLPIWLPIILMAMKAVINAFTNLKSNLVLSIIQFFGEPIIALLTGIFIALPLLQNRSNVDINQLFNSAFSKSGHILAIVAAGGIFGEIVRKNIELIDLESITFQSKHFWVFIPFLLTSFLKSAQGSSTVAIITAAHILQPLLDKFGIDNSFKTEIFLLAMGAGSMMVSHANDAYFWVITNFSKITEQESFKYYSPMSAIMGLSTITVLWVISIVFF